MYVMKTAGMTDTGRVRSNNEDAYSINNSLLIVADGMGGAAAGEIASSLAINTISEALKHISYTKDDEVTHAVTRAILKADKEIKKQTDRHPEYFGMGTTLVVSLHFDTRVLIGNVGDSRAYLITTSPAGSLSSSSDTTKTVDASAQTAVLSAIDESEEETKENKAHIRRITEDHSVVMELVRSGIISEEEIRIHPLRNRITRCVGSLHKEEPDFTWLDIHDDDVLVMCSDGLWELVHEDIILAIVSSSQNPEEMCSRLIDAANTAGGVDNITVIAAQFLRE